MVNVDEYSITEGVYEDRPYYYVIDRMSNVWALLDRALGRCITLRDLPRP